MMDWQPIDTAPKDGRRLLLATAGGYVGTGRHVDKFAPMYGDTSEGWYSDQLDRRFSPTHWMPLPKPPAL